jgi:hypothetical protein
MKIKWLTYSGSAKRHAFPVDEKRYGDWALCGRGSEAPKREGNQPLCGRCQWILEHFTESELTARRFARAGEEDFGEGHG